MNWFSISQKTTFFIFTAVKMSNLTTMKFSLKRKEEIDSGDRPQNGYRHQMGWSAGGRPRIVVC
jgi:hypothetical protein